jgi:hypothetical protein
MFLEGVRIDENVIHIRDSETIKILANDVIDVRLKRTGSAGETERHDIVLEMTIARTEGGFIFVSESDTKPIEGVADIYFCEVLCAFNAIKEL